MGGISNTLALVQLVLSLLELVPTSGQTPTRIPLGILVPDSFSQLKQIFENEFEKFNGTSTSLFQFDIQRLGSGHSVDVANSTKSMCSMVSTGILAMIGLTGGDVDHMVNDVADTYNIPYVNLNGPHSPPPSGESDGISHPYTVYIRPPFEKVISDFISFNQNKRTKIFYIFDNSAGFSRMERLTSRIRNEYRTLQVKPVLFKDVNQSQKKLREFDVDESDRASRFVLLDLSTTATLKTLLSQLSAVGKDSSNYHYLIGGSFLAELDLDDFKRNGAKLTGFNLIKHKAYGERLYLQNKSQVDLALATDAVAVVTHGLLAWHDSDPGALQGVPRHLENRKQGGSRCDQISTTSWKSGREILDAFKVVDFQGETGRVAFDGLGHRKDYELGIYELNNTMNRPEEIATWEPIQGLKLKSTYDAEHVTTVVKSNSSKTIIVTTILAAPYLMHKKSGPGRRLTGNDRYEGYLADLTQYLSSIGGFEYEFREVKDGRYGMKNPDGTWNGMIGELMRGEADVAIAPLTITSMRERVVDFSKPYMSIGISIMIKKTEKQLRSFFDVLSLGAWAAILFTYLVICLFYCFVDRFTRGICKQTNSNMAGSAETSNNSTSWSRWMLGLVCWLFTLSLFAVLTAQISKFSNSRSIQLSPIESADDLSKQQEIKYGTLDAGSTKEFFKNSRIPTYEQMWKSMNDNPDVFVKTTEEGVQRVRNWKGRYAFLLESHMNDYYNQRKPCDTMKVGKNLDAKSYGLAFPIHSDLGSRMNLILLELSETGALAKLEKKWWYDKGECLVDRASEDAPITLMREANDLAGLFYILIGGLVLSIVVLSIECFFESRKNKSFQLKPKE